MRPIFAIPIPAPIPCQRLVLGLALICLSGGLRGQAIDPIPQAAAQQKPNGAPAAAQPGRVGSFGYSPALGTVDPRAFGAVGDGVADDTAALQAWWNYGVAKARTLYLPTSEKCYKVSSPLDFGNFNGTMVIVGDLRSNSGGTSSQICYVNFPVPHRAVIDHTSHGTLVIQGISILPLGNLAQTNNALAASNVGSCIFSSPDTVGGASLEVYDSNLQCGGAAGDSAIQSQGQDDSEITRSRLYSLGNALDIGQSSGPGLTQSSYHTVGKGYGVTHIVISGDIIQSTHSPIALTGSYGDVVISDSDATHYIAMLNEGDNTHGIIDLSYACSAAEGNTLHIDGVRTENQSRAKGVTALSTGKCYVINGHIFADLLTDPAGTALSGNFQNMFIDSDSATVLLAPGTVLAGSMADTLSNQLWSNCKACASPNLSGSTVTGRWQSTDSALSSLTGNSGYFTLCANHSGTVNCLHAGMGPIGGGGSPAMAVSGVLDMTQGSGGRFRMLDSGWLTVSGGATTITLHQGYNNSPLCQVWWASVGNHTGVLEEEDPYHPAAGATIPVKSTVATDSGKAGYACLGF